MQPDIRLLGRLRPSRVDDYQFHAVGLAALRNVEPVPPDRNRRVRSPHDGAPGSPARRRHGRTAAHQGTGDIRRPEANMPLPDVVRTAEETEEPAPVFVGRPAGAATGGDSFRAVCLFYPA